MLHLLDIWPSLCRRLRDAYQALLFFDYDGTLTPIVPYPDLATLSAETGALLLRLSGQERYVVGVISGRSLPDLRAKVGIEGLVYAGNHGLEIQGPGIDFVHPEALRLAGVQDRLYEQLRDRLTGCQGVVIEHKGLTLSLHYRLAPDALVGEVARIFDATVSPFLEAGVIKTSIGKKVLEVRPNIPWDKGKAIAKLQALHSALHSIEAYSRTPPLTLFFGDDRTDEDGFGVVQETGGVAVFVGLVAQPTRAGYWLGSPEEVTKTLKLLAHV